MDLALYDAFVVFWLTGVQGQKSTILVKFVPGNFNTGRLWPCFCLNKILKAIFDQKSCLKMDPKKCQKTRPLSPATIFSGFFAS